MVLNQIDIYPINYQKPDLVLTYTLKEDNESLDMFKIWISPKEKNNIEVINYANLILYKVIIENKQPKQKDIYIAYQMLFSHKKWRNYEEKYIYINNINTLTKAPYNRYKEITKTYITNKIQGMYDKYIKEGV